MKLTKAGLVASVTLLALVSLAHAAEGDKVFRFGLSYVGPTGEFTESGETLEADVAVGVEMGFEYMFHDVVGFDFSLGLSSHDILAFSGGTEAKFGTVVQTPLMFGANFHVTRRSAIDFYLGPTLGYVLWENIDLSGSFGGGNVETSDGFAYGANLGLDVPFNESWSFAAGLRYVVSALETDEGTGDIEVDVDPLVFRAGLSMRF